MLTSGGTPFDAEGFASVIADLRRLYLLVGGGSNDLNQDSASVTQANTAGENANNAFKLRNVNLSTTAPTDGYLLAYSKARSQWEATSVSGTTGTNSGNTFLIAGNNLSDLTNVAAAQSILGIGSTGSTTVNSVNTNTLTVNSGSTLTGRVTTSTGVVIGGGLRVPVTIKNLTSYTAGAGDCFIVMALSGGASKELTLPSASGNPGKVLPVALSTLGNPLDVSRSGSDTVVGVTGIQMAADQKMNWFISDGVSNWWRTLSA